MSWSELEQIENTKISVPSKEEFLVAKVFESEEGQKALAYLKAQAYEKKPLVLNSDGINTAIDMAMREGEINFYRKIEKILTKINNYVSKSR